MDDIKTERKFQEIEHKVSEVGKKQKARVTWVSNFPNNNDFYVTVFTEKGNLNSVCEEILDVLYKLGEEYHYGIKSYNDFWSGLDKEAAIDDSEEAKNTNIVYAKAHVKKE